MTPEEADELLAKLTRYDIKWVESEYDMEPTLDGSYVSYDQLRDLLTGRTTISDKKETFFG